jgi:hypothetical protein
MHVLRTWQVGWLAGAVASAAKKSPVLSDPCQVSAVLQTSKGRQFPDSLFSFTLIMSLRIRATQKVHSTIMLDNRNTTAKHSTDQNTRPIEDQKRKGINGLLGSLFLREPSGSALAKAQAQHKLSAKAKSTAPKRRDTRTSAESDKSSLPTSLASRPSISSTSTSLRSSKS